MAVAQVVENLLHEMRVAARQRDMDKFDAVSDQMQTLVMAYAEPDSGFPFVRGSLSKKERRIADLLWSRLGRETSVDAVLNAMYFDNPDGEPEAAKIAVGVFVHRIRNKIEGSGYRIEKAWGGGYTMLKGDGRGTREEQRGPNRHRPKKEVVNG